uniref:Uncharacterized protein n=1 Tax=Glossina pallidipes TaxID=7398 RepID=A0A1A9ZTN2_GLOPL
MQQTIANEIATNNCIASDLHKDVFETFQDTIRSSDQTMNLLTSTESGGIKFDVQYDKSRSSLVDRIKFQCYLMQSNYYIKRKDERENSRQRARSLSTQFNNNKNNGKKDEREKNNVTGSNSTSENETAEKEETDEEDNLKNVRHASSFDDDCYVLDGSNTRNE